MNDPYYRNRLKASGQARKSKKRVQPLSEQIKSASQMLLVTIGSILLVSTVSFLYISSLKSAKGYELQKLQVTHEELLIQNRKLQRELNEAQALKNLKNIDSIEEMVSTEDSNYLGEDGDLAAR